MTRIAASPAPILLLRIEEDRGCDSRPDAASDLTQERVRGSGHPLALKPRDWSGVLLLIVGS
jgi:hypothetical protein